MGRYLHSIPGSDVRTSARLHHATRDRKLAPVRDGEYSGNRHRPEPTSPYCAATYVAIEPTCPDSCRFKAGACYVKAGFTRTANLILEEAAIGLGPDAVIRAEVELIDKAFGRHRRVPQDGGRHGRSGRDLRLHIGGDTTSISATLALATAAMRYQARGGGAVWTYTHRWREIPRFVWGPISVLASIETVRDGNMARARGYVPALTLAKFPSRRAFRAGDMVDKVIPCPAETGTRTCVECRLCLDVGALRRREQAIGFELHGGEMSKVTLPVVL